MLANLARSLAIKAVRKRTGIPEPGVLTTTMLTMGASLLLSRGRRPVGAALLVAGGLLLWHERTPETVDVRPEPGPAPAPAPPAPHAPASAPAA